MGGLDPGQALYRQGVTAHSGQGSPHSRFGKMDNVKFVPDSPLHSVLTGHGLGCVMSDKSVKPSQL